MILHDTYVIWVEDVIPGQVFGTAVKTLPGMPTPHITCVAVLAPIWIPVSCYCTF